VSGKLVNIAKNLRKRSTDAENLLWRHLRVKQLEGLKFRRQQPIGNYIVDFVCFEKRVVIEVDGGQHTIEKERDNERDRWLKGQGFIVLRFWNNDVLKNINGVLEVIGVNCLNHPPLNPLPSREGRRRGKKSHQGSKEKREYSHQGSKEKREYSHQGSKEKRECFHQGSKEKRECFHQGSKEKRECFHQGSKEKK